MSMTDRPDALVVKMRPYYGWIEPPDDTLRACTITGVGWEGRAQTFFTALLDRPIRFGDLGESERVIVWARGPDFIHRDGDGFAFARSGTAYGYVGIDRDECTTENHRRATIRSQVLARRAQTLD